MLDKFDFLISQQKTDLDIVSNYPIEKILVLFSDEEITRKSVRIFKILEEIREDFQIHRGIPRGLIL